MITQILTVLFVIFIVLPIIGFILAYPLLKAASDADDQADRMMAEVRRHEKQNGK